MQENWTAIVYLECIPYNPKLIHKYFIFPFLEQNPRDEELLGLE